MNVQKVSQIGGSSIFSFGRKNNMSSAMTEKKYHNHYFYDYDKKESDTMSINHIVTGTVVGGIIGALFSGNSKSMMTIAMSSLRGAGIALLGIVAFKCVTSFMHLDLDN